VARTGVTVLAHPVLIDRDKTHRMERYTTRPEPARKLDDLRHYFEYSNHGVEVVEDGLQEISFGEFLVEQSVLDRFQLFRALQMQDRKPGVRLGECAAALGYAPIASIEKMFSEFVKLHTVTVG
jgi:hypothetical protein